MSQFLRRIAPAVLVGTAAVVVVSTAGGGAEAVTAAGTSASSAPEGRSLGAPGATGRTAPQPGGSDSNDLDALLRQLFDGKLPGGDDDDDDDVPSFPQPPVTSPQGGSTAGGSTADTGGTATGACDAAEVTGPVVQTEWGPVQVAARVSSGRVCAVRTIMTPDGDRKSMMINARAVPRIEQNVLAAGDATFDGISGATVTTEGYRESLQAILDGA